jgi:serralysin
LATIQLTAIYGALDDWPGPIFEAWNGTTVVRQDAARFVFRHPSSAGEFANYRIEVSGKGFSYLDGVPVEGTMTAVRVLNGAGSVILSFSGLGSNPIVNDFSQFYASVFGTMADGEDFGVTPNAKVAWSHLMAGDDKITGTDGDDRALVGFDAGDDVYRMMGGDDYVLGGVGNDTYYGGDGYDTLSYGETNWNEGAAAFRGATINVQTGVILDPWGGTDKVVEFEQFKGSRFSDKFIGNNTERDRFEGGRGNDVFDGGANTFNLDGELTEDRRDQVQYNNDIWEGARRGIIVDLETSFANGSIRGTIRDGFGNRDTVIDIERVVGTRFNDVFVGSRVDNVFTGMEGRDQFDGQEGFDTLAFTRGNPTSGITVDLSRSTGQIRNDGFGNIENAISMEGIWGTDLADSVKGGSAQEEFWLGLGRDTMTGGGGSDTFVWESRSEFGQGDVITDFRAGGAAADRLGFSTAWIEGMDDTLRLVNGTAATTAQATFIFNSTNKILYWDPDGTGSASALAVVRLPNVAALTAANFDLWT